MEYFLPLAMMISFLAVYLLSPVAKKFLYAVGIVGLDLHKKNRPKISSGGGIIVAFGILTGLFLYIGLETFLGQNNFGVEEFLAVTSSILIVTFVGFLDDLNVKSRPTKTKEGKDIRVGIPQKIKPLLTLFAAIPLIVVNAGQTTITIPFVGQTNVGLLYPFLLVPIGMVGATNMINMLGGFNGSEAGMAIIYTSALGIYAFLSQSSAFPILFITLASLLGFIKYNWHPAKILPGDSLTYLLGSVVATSVIVGNIELAGVVILFPFFIEGLLKARKKFDATSLGKLRSDGKLDPPYGNKIYSWTHLWMNLGRFSEQQITILLIVCQLLFSVLGLLLLWTKII